MTVTKASMDGGFLMWGLLAIIGILPTIAVLLTVIYYSFLVWETVTFQRIISRLSQHLRWKQAKKALDAGAPLVVIQTPPTPPGAVVLVQQGEPQSPPPAPSQTA